MDEIITQPEVNEVTAQPEANETQETVEKTETEASQPRIKVKYNKEEKELSIDEARPFIEKGMNYDKVKERLEKLENDLTLTSSERDKLKSSKVLKWAMEEAERRNTTPEELIDSIQDAAYAKQHNVPVDEAKRVRLLREKEDSLSDREQRLTAAEQREAEKSRMDAELEEFRKEFPDVKEALPDEVIKKVQYGMPLVEAYKDYLSKADLEMRLKELEQEVKVKKVNETNAEASTGKLGDQSETHDAELTEERIAKMTPAEREKYHPKIWAFLTGQK